MKDSRVPRAILRSVCACTLCPLSGCRSLAYEAPGDPSAFGFSVTLTDGEQAFEKCLLWARLKSAQVLSHWVQPEQT